MTAGRTPAPALTPDQQTRVDAFERAEYPAEVAEARVRASISEGESQIASGAPLTTLDQALAADRPDVAGQLDARPARDRLAEALAAVIEEWGEYLRQDPVNAMADHLLAPDGAVTELIAEAVAEARRPFLALADELEADDVSYSYAADRIRAAAAPEEGR